MKIILVKDDNYNTDDYVPDSYQYMVDDAFNNGYVAAIHDFDNLDIVNVRFNPPATIVFWNDGTKTVVKDEEYFPHKEDKWPKWKQNGLVNAILKKYKPGYPSIITKWESKEVDY